MDRRGALRRIPLVVGLIAALAAPALHAQWEIKTADGKSSFKIGFLAVMRADSEEQTNGKKAENLYFRRLRILAGGKLSDNWSFFFETDSPNLGKSDATGAKNTGDVYIQDFVVTYEGSKEFKLDFGMILIPFTRNSGQSAATHLASDYGPYSFLQSGVTQSRVGRDYGVQARGALAGGKLEYRLGLFDGARGTEGNNSLRYAGRIAYNVFDPDTGLYYTGNNLGAKKMLTFGVGYDSQENYKAIGADVFYDQPVGKEGSAFTLQGDYMKYDGGTTFTTLPEQTTYLAEIGYLFGSARVQPWLQYASRNFQDPTKVDETQTWVGLNYRIAKHNRVVRLAYGQISPDHGNNRDVIQLTLQIFQF